MKLTAESTVINDNKLNTDIDNAQETANQAKTVADNTAQYFWFKSTGNDTGAHISEKTQAQFEASPSGGNLLARSNGIAVRQGLTELAQFTADTARIGQSGQQRVEVTSSAVDVYDSGNNLATKMDTNGLSLYKQGTLRAQTTANGLDIYGSGSSAYPVAQFISNGLQLGIGDTWGLDIAGTSNGISIDYSINSGQKIASLALDNSKFTVSTEDELQISCSEGHIRLTAGSNIYLSAPLGEVILNGHNSGIGSVLSASSSNAITTAGIDTYTQGASLTIPTGSWVITGEWAFNTGSSSSARNIGVVLSTSSGSANTGILSRQRIMANNNGFAELQVTYVGNFASDTTVYVKGASSMTYTTASANSIRAVRIA